MATYRTYKIEDAGGVAVHRAVVRGAAAEGAAKPGAANAPKFVGITSEPQATQYKGVPEQLDGVALCEMYGSGSMGDAVNIGDTSGRLAGCQAALEDLAETAAYLTYVVGFAEKAWTQTGDIIPVRLNPFVKVTPIT